MAPRPLPQSWSLPSPLAPCNGAQQRHHVHSFKVGRHPPLWHPAMAPGNGTTSTPPKLVITLPPNHSTLQWHPAMVPCPLPQSWPSPSPPTTAHYNGTPRKHPAMAPRPLHPAMAPWCHVQSAKVVRRPPPLLELRTPIAIAIWGINYNDKIKASWELTYPTYEREFPDLPSYL